MTAILFLGSGLPLVIGAIVEIIGSSCCDQDATSEQDTALKPAAATCSLQELDDQIAAVWCCIHKAVTSSLVDSDTTRRYNEIKNVGVVNSKREGGWGRKRNPRRSPKLPLHPNPPSHATGLSIGQEL